MAIHNAFGARELDKVENLGFWGFPDWRGKRRGLFSEDVR